MPGYRRNLVEGGTFFFTVVTADRQPILTSPGAPTLLKQAFVQCHDRLPFTLEGLVILPDHLHCIWTLPLGDSDFPARWASIKAYFTRRWIALDGQEAERSAYKSLILHPPTPSGDDFRHQGVIPRGTSNPAVWASESLSKRTLSRMNCTAATAPAVSRWSAAAGR